MNTVYINLVLILLICVIVTLYIKNILCLEEFTVYNNFVYSNKLSRKDIYNLKRGQGIMTNMLKDFHNICIKNNITYFIWGGNLLGSQLYNGWIPWDGDVDLYVTRDDYNKLENILIKNPPINTWYQTLKTDPFYKRPPGNNNPLPNGKIRHLKSCYTKCQDGVKWHNGLQIDINTFQIVNNRIIFDTLNPAEIRIQKKITSKDIYPLKLVKYDSIYVYIPNNPEKILDLHYTNKWRKMPPIRSRYPHEGNISLSTCPHHYKLYPKLYN
jgi:phosphorylcholine metabolism protein LicD